jgi:hypothetical protein
VLRLAVALFLAVARPGSAQTTDSVTVEERVLLTADLTAADARRRAIEGALAEGVRRVAGVRVQSSALSVLDERGEAIRGGYVSVVQLDATGRAVDYRVLEEGWQTITHPELGSQVYFRARLLVFVERESGVPDPSFSADASVNAPLYFVRSERPPANDEIVVTIRSSRSAWLTIFAIADDSAQRVAPNEYVRGVSVSADAAVEFPDSEWRQRGLRLRASLPPGRPGRRELLMVIATRDQVTPPAARLSVMDVQRWLVRIPADRRAIAFAAYEVRRQ